MLFDLCFVGLGYIGLPTAALFASVGKHVLGVDIDDHKLHGIAAGQIGTTEPGLSELLEQGINAGRLVLSNRPAQASAFIIAVPTPLSNDSRPDTSAVFEAATSIVEALAPGNLIVVESTCPPGTTKALRNHIEQLRPDLAGRLHFAYCPERVLPGNALAELKRNDRVLGGINREDANLARDLYASFCTGRLQITDSTTAEIVKLAENSFRDINIAFANELSLIADGLGVNVWDVINLANMHPRVNILNPGVGVGGHCIAVDPWFLVASDPSASRLIRTARSVNDAKPRWVVSKIEEAIAVNECEKVLLLGLTFKPNIDDVRSSPALAIATNLAKRNPETTFEIIEPNLRSLPKGLEFPNVKLSRVADTKTERKLVCKLVAHREFAEYSGNQKCGIQLLDFTETASS
ncbi:nucleotide sugar dehydrogenase [Corynebacterium lehmanniae]